MWTNQDSVVHDVPGDLRRDVQVGPVRETGKSYTYKPTKAGTISYVCTIHPGMQGTLTVVRWSAPVSRAAARSRGA